MVLPPAERHELFGVLVSMASVRAEGALDNWHEGGQRELSRVPLDASIATELMTKAFLAAHNIALLLPERGNEDTLLQLTGFGPESSALHEVQTVGLAQALTRVKRILSTSFTADRKIILNARNPVVHLGTVSDAVAVSALRSMVRLHDELGRALGDWPDELFDLGFWGDHAETVRHLLDDAPAGLARAKVAAAKVAYQRKFGRLEGDDRAVLARILGGRQQWATQHVQDVACPSCQATGVLAFDGIDESEPFEKPRPSSGEPARYAHQRAEVLGFDCSVCGLSLEGAMVADAGMTWADFDMPDRLIID